MLNSGFPWGVATLFVNRIELGCYLLRDKAFNFVPSEGLAEETLLLSCEVQWTFAPRPPVQSWCAMGGVGTCPFVSGLFV